MKKQAVHLEKKLVTNAPTKKKEFYHQTLWLNDQLGDTNQAFLHGLEEINWLTIALLPQPIP